MLARAIVHGCLVFRESTYNPHHFPQIHTATAVKDKVNGRPPAGDIAYIVQYKAVYTFIVLAVIAYYILGLRLSGARPGCIGRETWIGPVCPRCRGVGPMCRTTEHCRVGGLSDTTVHCRTCCRTAVGP